MTIRIDFLGRLDGIERTPQGGLKVRANLTRSGVFKYGSQGELRHPDDVFKADALASLRGAPLTIGHAAHITPANYTEHARGHVGDDVSRVDNFVSATLYVQDEETCRRIELGKTDPNHKDALVELSCGYEVTMVPESGIYEGEKYDSRQTGHKYNHVAMGPRDWGRAGRDVRMVFDSYEAARSGVEGRSYAPGMTPEEKAAYDAAIQAAKDAKAKADAAEAKADALQAQADAAKAADEKRRADAVRKSVLDGAKAVLGATFTGEGKTDREIRVAVITKVRPTFDAKDRSDAYVEAAFDSAIETARADADGLAALNRSLAPSRGDAGADDDLDREDADDPIAKALNDQNRRVQDAWTTTNSEMRPRA